MVCSEIIFTAIILLLIIWFENDIGLLRIFIRVIITQFRWIFGLFGSKIFHRFCKNINYEWILNICLNEKNYIIIKFKKLGIINTFIIVLKNCLQIFKININFIVCILSLYSLPNFSAKKILLKLLYLNKSKRYLLNLFFFNNTKNKYNPIKFAL